MPFENPFLNTIRGSTVPQFSATGTQDIGTVGNFYRTLLGGDRQALLQQASPEANTARAAADAAKREAASRGTARTGGTAAGEAQTEDQVRANLDTLLGQQRSQAAQGLQGVASTELQTMMEALGIGTQAAQSDINSRRAAHAAMWSALIGGAADVATGGLAGGFKNLFGRGGGGPPVTPASAQAIPPFNPFPGGNPQTGPFGPQTPAGIPFPVSPNLSIGTEGMSGLIGPPGTDMMGQPYWETQPPPFY